MKKRYYVCSPCRANTNRELKENMRRAQEYTAYVEGTYKVSAYAPHAYMPNLLNDSIIMDRSLAMDFCLRLLATCDAICVFGDTITEGMEKEIEYASMLCLPVYAANAVIERVELIYAHGSVSKVLSLHNYDPDEAEDVRSTYDNPIRCKAADIISCFEDMLDEHEVTWESDERSAYETDGGTEAAIIFGSEYDDLLDTVQEILEDAVFYGDKEA